MFRFEMKQAVRRAGAAVALAAGVAMASPSSAITLTNLSMNTSIKTYISGPGVPGGTEYVYGSPVKFTAYETAPGDTLPFLAFCVDIYHNINLGNLQYAGQPSGSGLIYDEADTATMTNFKPTSPTTLSAYTKKQIGGLVNLGTYLYAGGAYNTGDGGAVDVAAIQGAIWELANGPAYSVTGGNIAGFGSLVDSYKVGVHGEHGTYFRLITPRDGRTQSFAFAAVPEPTTWAMMLVGFFAMGAAIRNRRRAPASAAA